MRKKVCTTLIFGAFSLILFSTPALAQEFDELLYSYDENFPQEKIHIHYDRPYYSPGETIWFKAYLISHGLPSQISKNLYADLIDEQGKVLDHKLMPVISGGAASAFEIPENMKGEKIFVKAYTAWMLNFDSTLLYHKALSILQPQQLSKSAAPGTYSLSFFPEGGNLVDGISSRLAFKAHDQNGLPFPVKGIIKDASGTVVANFEARHDGMGDVSFLPEAGKTYTAVWKDKNGKTIETTVPDALEMGAVLSVERTDGKLYYSITRSENATEDFTSFYAVAHMDHQFLYAAKINLSTRTSVRPQFPTDSLPDGIVQLTIFNAKKIPVAERIFFVNHNHYYFITDLHLTEKNLAARSRNVLQMDVGGSLLSNISVSVTDESLSRPTSHRENIFSDLLLTTNLKGYVHNPAYYFSEQSETVAANLDLVMMTNGWRRFRWEDLLQHKTPEIKYIPADYLTISGRVLSGSGMSLQGRELTGILTNKSGGQGNYLQIPLDADGRFKLEGVVFYDTAQLYYQINNDKDKRLTDRSSFAFDKTFEAFKIPRHDYFKKMYSPIPPEPQQLKIVTEHHKQWLAQEKSQRNVKTLEAVTVKSTGKTARQKAEEEFTSGFFSGGDSYSFVTEDDISATAGQTVLSYLQGRVAGINITLSGQGSVTWRGSETSMFLNEMPTDVQQIQEIPMTDVAYIKVFRPPFFGASFGGSGGAIAVYLKKGRSQSFEGKGMSHITLNGYAVMKEFYAPDYETNIGGHPGEDLRTTLYWNPFVFMDKKTRRLSIPFFNNDQATKLRVVVEGINELGQFCREEKIFE